MTLPPPPPRPELSCSDAFGVGVHEFEDILRRHGARPGPLESYDSGYRWHLESCPFNAEHKGTSAAVFWFPPGRLAFRCLHDSCAERGWKEFKEKLGITFSRKSETASMSALLVEEGREGSLFVDDRGESCVCIDHPAGGRRTMVIDSKSFRLHLTKLYQDRTGRAPKDEALNDAIRTLEAEADASGRREQVFDRFAYLPDDASVYIDMADDRNRVIHITQAGWNVESVAPVFFRRSSNMLALPEPRTGGRLVEFFEAFPLSPTDMTLCACYLTCLPFVGVPLPLLIIHGLQGSGKSTLAAFMRLLVDPVSNRTNRLSRSISDVEHVVERHAVPVFDNVSAVSQDMADFLCQVTTGGGHERRRLYTNDESSIKIYKRPVIMTSIHVPRIPPDLMDRALLIDMKAIHDQNRKPERDLNAWFDLHRASFLGAILDAIVGVLRSDGGLEQTIRAEADLPRMADFFLLSAAAAESLEIDLNAGVRPLKGWRSFQYAYSFRLKSANDELLSGDPFIEFFLRTLKTDPDLMSKYRLQGVQKIKISSSELLQVLRGAPEVRLFAIDRTWPSDAASVGRKLTSFQKTLGEHGVLVENGRSGTSRYWNIDYSQLTVKDTPMPVRGSYP